MGHPPKLAQAFPFGDWLTCAGSDVSPMHFTGKEHDPETGLENFGARYDASAMGRFMTPDWSRIPTDVPYAQFGNPQTLDLYIYVADNPMTRLDADGHGCTGYDGKQHSWVWCLFNETKEQYDKRIQAERQWLKNNVLTDQGGPVDPKWVDKLSNNEADALYNQGTQIQRERQQNNQNIPSVGSTPPGGAAGQSKNVMASRPEWANTPGGYVNWLKNLQGDGVKLSATDADEIIMEAKKLGVEVRLDPPHPGTNWDVPHLNIGNSGQVHLEVPTGYSNPSVPTGSVGRP